MSQVSLAQTMISSLLNESRHNAISPGQLAGIYQVLLDLFSLDEKARNQAIADMTRLREQAAKSVSDARSVLEGLNFLPFDSIVRTRQIANSTLNAGQIYFCTDEQKFLVTYDKGGGELDSRQPDGYNRNMKGRDDALFLCLQDRLLYQVSLDTENPSRPVATIHLYNSTADAGQPPFEIKQIDLYNPTAAEMEAAGTGTIALMNTVLARLFRIKTADGWHDHEEWNYTSSGHAPQAKAGLYACRERLFWIVETVGTGLHNPRTTKIYEISTNQDRPRTIEICLGDDFNIYSTARQHFMLAPEFIDQFNEIQADFKRKGTDCELATLAVIIPDPDKTFKEIARIPVSFTYKDDAFISTAALIEHEGQIFRLTLNVDLFGTTEGDLDRVTLTPKETFKNLRERGTEISEIFYAGWFDRAFGNTKDMFNDSEEAAAAEDMPPNAIIFSHLYNRFLFVGNDHTCTWTARQAMEAGIDIDKGHYASLGDYRLDDGVTPTPGRIYYSSRDGKYFIIYGDNPNGSGLALREIDMSHMLIDNYR